MTDVSNGGIRPQLGAWICPRCETVNAWWKGRCHCKSDLRAALEQIANDTEPNHYSRLQRIAAEALRGT